VLFAHPAGPDVPPLTGARMLTGWVVEPLPLLAVLLAGGLYAYGVSRLRRRGDAWSPWRTASFLGPGIGSIVLATSSAVAAYDTVLLWAHMVQHMLLAMVAPIFLALGAPVTLALRTLPPRGRRTLLALLHSRAAAVLTFPVVAGGLYVVTPYALYLTGLYEQTLRNPLAHDLNHLHLVLVGCLWFWVVLGLDPLPRRPAYPLRMLAVFATLPFHAILGVTIMGASTPLAGDWYAGLARAWGPSLAEDQRLAGGLLWGSGDIVGIVVLAALFAQWARESEREAAREDRRLDRLDRTSG
jgi:cytochrome c oxidase assembly factor CtaG